MAIQSDPSARDVAPLKQDYITPPEYLEAVREVFGGQICLDPASSDKANKIVQAKQYFTIEDDGLAQSWAPFAYHKGVVAHYGSWNVFNNPPYGRREGTTGPFNLELWTEKFFREYYLGHFEEGILLTAAYVGRGWFKRLWKCPVCIVEGRIKFIDPETMEAQKQPRWENAFAYVGPRPYRFHHVFSKFGTVVRQVDIRQAERFVADDWQKQWRFDWR